MRNFSKNHASRTLGADPGKPMEIIQQDSHEKKIQEKLAGFQEAWKILKKEFGNGLFKSCNAAGT